MVLSRRLWMEVVTSEGVWMLVGRQDVWCRTIEVSIQKRLCCIASN
jgi:hypothetical protein